MHFERQDHEPWTKVVWINEISITKDVLDIFLNAFESHNSDEVTLWNKHGKQFPLSGNIFSFMDSKEDCFVQVKKLDDVTSPNVASASSNNEKSDATKSSISRNNQSIEFDKDKNEIDPSFSATSKQIASHQTLQPNVSTIIGSKKSTKLISPDVGINGIRNLHLDYKNNKVISRTVEEERVFLKDTLNDIQRLIDDKKYRKAKEICNNYLTTVNSSEGLILEASARVLLLSNHYENAIKVASEILPQLSGDVRAACALTLGRAHYAIKQYPKAMDYLNMVIANPVANSDMAQLDVASSLISLLYDMGSHQPASLFLNAVATNAAAMHHPNTLVVYCKLAFHYDKISEAIQALLKAVVLDPKDKQVLQMFKKIMDECQNPKYMIAVEEIYNQVKPTRQSKDAYSYLAMVAKNCSCIGVAELFLNKVLELTAPLSAENANDVLTMVHLYEVSCKHDNIFQLLIHFFSSISTFVFGNTNHSVVLNCVGIVEILESAQQSNSAAKRNNRNYDFLPPDLNDLYIESYASVIDDVSKSSKTSNLYPRSLQKMNQHPIDSSTQSHSQDNKSFIQFKNNEYDVLAICFTVVKILYVMGYIRDIPKLVDIIEPIRRISKDQLHTTSIRNEHAYYLCVLGLVVHNFNPNRERSLCDPLRSSSSFNDLSDIEPVYVVGDSHCLSSSWCVVDIDGKGTLKRLVPKLVTGLKQWHLNPSSNFYPKENFNQVMASIPNASDVSKMVCMCATCIC